MNNRAKSREGGASGSRNSAANSSTRSNNLINRAKAESRERERESGTSSQRIGGGGVIRKPSHPSAMTGRSGSRGFDLESQKSGIVGTGRGLGKDGSQEAHNRSNQTGLRDNSGLSGDVGQPALKSTSNIDGTMKKDNSIPLSGEDKPNNTSNKSSKPPLVSSKPSFSGAIKEGEEGTIQTVDSQAEVSNNLDPKINSN